MPSKQGRDVKEISKHFPLAISSVINVIKKPELGGTVEVSRARSGRPEKTELIKS